MRFSSRFWIRMVSAVSALQDTRAVFSTLSDIYRCLVGKAVLNIEAARIPDVQLVSDEVTSCQDDSPKNDWSARRTPKYVPKAIITTETTKTSINSTSGLNPNIWRGITRCDKWCPQKKELASIDVPVGPRRWPGPALAMRCVSSPLEEI
jgi:hypothetical protein